MNSASYDGLKIFNISSTLSRNKTARLSIRRVPGIFSYQLQLSWLLAAFQQSLAHDQDTFLGFSQLKINEY